MAPFDGPLPNRSICCRRGCRLCRYPLPGIAVSRDMGLSPILVVRGSRCARKQGNVWRSILQRQIEKCRERHKGVNTDKRLSGQRLSVSACRPVEHPCWNFPPTFCLRPIQRAAKDDIVSLLDGLMNANSATKPRMMPIKTLAKNGPVGVLKRCCITRLARTFQSKRTRRRREQYIPLVAFCLPHFSAAFIICTCEFDFRRAYEGCFSNGSQRRHAAFSTAVPN